MPVKTEHIHPIVFSNLGYPKEYALRHVLIDSLICRSFFSKQPFWSIGSFHLKFLSSPPVFPSLIKKICRFLFVSTRMVAVNCLNQTDKHVILAAIIGEL